MWVDILLHCHSLFKELGILPLCSQYILSLAMFVAKNMDNFKINSDIHPYNTRTTTNLHYSLVRSTKYQKGTYLSIFQASRSTTVYPHE